MVLAASLSNLVGTANASGAPASTRVAMLFTSTLRRRLASLERAQRVADGQSAALSARRRDATTALKDAVANGTSEQVQLATANAQAINELIAANNAKLPTLKQEYRALFPAISQREVMPVIAMMLNPNSVQFRQGKRITSKDTREGKVFFHFTNEQGRNDDVLVISAKGNTGNLDRRVAAEIADAAHASGAAGYDPEATRRLMTWHNLYLLTHEPVLLPDGTENVMTITYTSKAFPVPIDLHGHFNAALEFNEEGTKPHSLAYSFEFTVRWSDPPLTDLLDLISDALIALTSTEQGIASGAAIAGSNVGIR